MKTFLITGADKGIGRALMEACLEQGHRVIGTVYTGSVPFTHSLFTPIQIDLASHRVLSNVLKMYKHAVNLSMF